MKKNAIAFIAIAALSSISLGFTYIGNNSADQQVKLAVTANQHLNNLESIPNFDPSFDRNSKRLSSWD